MKNKKMKISGFMLASIIVLVSFVYAVNVQPLVIGESGGMLPYSDLNSFSSYEELTEFLTSGASRYHSLDISIPMQFQGMTQPREMFIDDIELSAEWSNMGIMSKNSAGGELVDWSQTNVQVTGVDEPDIVKTDGTYLYIVSNNRVIIILAVPAENAEILSEIEINSNLSIKNIFINGDRLVIFAEDYNYPIYRTLEPVVMEDETTEISVEPTAAITITPRWYSSPDSHILIFDLENLENTELVKDVVVPGRLSGARMIGDFVYMITNQYSYDIYRLEKNQTIIPTIMINGETKEISLSNILYVNTTEESSSVTNIVSVNIHDDSQDVTAKMFLLGNSHLLYVSRDNIYITYSTRNYDYDLLREVVEEVLNPYLPESYKEELELVDTLSITEYQKQTVAEWILQNFTSTMNENLKQSSSMEIMRRIDRTVIHRIGISDGEISYEAQGTVPGSAKNQFSMNEYDGYLRISTTIEGWRVSNFISRVDSQNNIYVLNMDLEIVGSLEGLAPDEEIYATRFLGDKCYLVTFRQMDPFFVIDLSNPNNPTVLGELKIPGFSTYLHPYDETHVIGIGRNGSKIKVALYDVSDVSNPIELSKYEIDNNDGSWWRTQSAALDEHKAFLFDREKNLLVIPAGSGNKQSAYVFDITIEDGVKLKGKIAHSSPIENTTEEDEDSYWYGYDYDYSIHRVLYIGDVLYTISNNMVKMNNLDDLSEINSVELNN